MPPRARRRKPPASSDSDRFSTAVLPGCMAQSKESSSASCDSPPSAAGCEASDALHSRALRERSCAEARNGSSGSSSTAGAAGNSARNGSGASNRMFKEMSERIASPRPRRSPRAANANCGAESEASMSRKSMPPPSFSSPSRKCARSCNRASGGNFAPHGRCVRSSICACTIRSKPRRRSRSPISPCVRSEKPERSDDISMPRNCQLFGARTSVPLARSGASGASAFAPGSPSKPPAFASSGNSPVQMRSRRRNSPLARSETASLSARASSMCRAKSSSGPCSRPRKSARNPEAANAGTARSSGPATVSVMS